MAAKKAKSKGKKLPSKQVAKPKLRKFANVGELVEALGGCLSWVEVFEEYPMTVRGVREAWAYAKTQSKYTWIIGAAFDKLAKLRPDEFLATRADHPAIPSILRSYLRRLDKNDDCCWSFDGDHSLSPSDHLLCDDESALRWISLANVVRMLRDAGFDVPVEKKQPKGTREAKR